MLMRMLKKYFIRGLLIILPIGATYLILKTLVVGLEGLLGGLLRKYFEFYIPGFGIVVLLSLIILAGIFGGNIIGAKVVEWWDLFLNKLPVVNKIYSIIKSIVDTITNNTGRQFNNVYLLEYPRKGLYCLGFLTSNTSMDIPDLRDLDLVNVFVPTAPNPTSGVFVMIPRSDLIELPISVEEGMKMILSGGFYISSSPENITNSDKRKKNNNR